MIGIYKITNPKSKIDIGQRRNLLKRENQYAKQTKLFCRQLKLANSIKKYGWIFHIFQIVEICDFDELNIKERYWQEYYDSIEKGLNCIYTKTSDKPALFGQETRRRMSKSQIGKKLSLDTRSKMSKSKKGVPIGIGKVLTAEHKKAISDGFKPKFNIIELKKIIEMYNNNISLRKISLKFNSNHTTINKYIKKYYENITT